MGDCANRVSLIDESNRGFLLCFGEDGCDQIRFLELLGTGGSALVYKAELRQGDSVRQVVVKEYYPEDANLAAGVEYYRRHAGEELKVRIVSPGGERKKLWEEERKRREDNVNRELGVNQKLFYAPGQDAERESNSPYLYAMWKISMEFGDSSYLVLDTSQGMTLKAYMESLPQKRLDWESALLFLKKMLVILDHIGEKNVVHGDIYQDNIWVSGSGAASYLKLLDFGSSFFRDEYQVRDDSEAALTETADKIIRNTAIGSSHQDTRSDMIHRFLEAKQKYQGIREAGEESVRYAGELLKAYQEIDQRADIFSLLNIFFRLLIGDWYVGYNTSMLVAEVLGLPEDHILVRRLHELMKINYEMKVQTTQQIAEWITETEAILDHSCTPEVLLESVLEECRRDPADADALLFAEIEVEKL